MQCFTGNQSKFDILIAFTASSSSFKFQSKVCAPRQVLSVAKLSCSACSPAFARHKLFPEPFTGLRVNTHLHDAHLASKILASYSAGKQLYGVKTAAAALIGYPGRLEWMEWDDVSGDYRRVSLLNDARYCCPGNTESAGKSLFLPHGNWMDGVAKSGHVNILHVVF